MDGEEKCRVYTYTIKIETAAIALLMITQYP